MPYTQPDLRGALPLISRGKVREIYEIKSVPNRLLFVASDRISAFDVNVGNGVPDKGAILTLISHHWFHVLTSSIKGLRTHFLDLKLPDEIPPSAQDELRFRSMQVRRLKVFPIEAIVRGYITGSAWSEYKKTRTLSNGEMLPDGLKESQEFPGGPRFTPSTKAEAGGTDENITIQQAEDIVGKRYLSEIQELSLKIYTSARDYARDRGIIIADTKFEFGLDKETDQIYLVDEVLTPDSSRFWAVDKYVVGRPQESFDKQYLRDWLTKEGLKGKPNVKVPDEIMQETGKRYQEAFSMLTSQSLEEAKAAALNEMV
ncbi:MAG: hypothetical protein Q9227_001703 [Pyrenula ochraceoflavens]